MITQNIYKTILIDPALDGSNQLFIVTGFSSATFKKHLTDINNKNLNVKINLLIGMKKARTDHQAYLDMFETSKNKFDCHYYDSNQRFLQNVCMGKRSISTYWFSG